MRRELHTQRQSARASQPHALPEQSREFHALERNKTNSMGAVSEREPYVRIMILACSISSCQRPGARAFTFSTLTG